MTWVTQEQYDRFKAAGVDVRGLKVYAEIEINRAPPIYSGPPRNRSERRAARMKRDEHA